MAIPIRSQLSAKSHKRTLFVVQAQDEYLSYIDKEHATLDFSKEAVKRGVARAVLAHPCMNETGRLPPFAMFHIEMQIRLTLTSEPRVAVTDAAGIVMGIEFDDREPKRHQEATTNGELSIVRMLYMPKALYVKLEEVEGASEFTPTEWISPRACNQHAVEGADIACTECSFFKNCVVVPAVTNLRP